MEYNSENIFARILHHEVTCQKIYEDDYALAFHDINPRAKIHALVIPKGAFVSSLDFHATATDQQIVGYYRAIDKVIELLGLKAEKGYRLLSNSGINAGQEVPHFHTHIFAGQSLGPMICVEAQK
jgi:Diadenosine tetraphosphate (Ap4A) hydrolase and other HIT family hydrolases